MEYGVLGVLEFVEFIFVSICHFCPPLEEILSNMKKFEDQINVLNG